MGCETRRELARLTIRYDYGWKGMGDDVPASSSTEEEGVDGWRGGANLGRRGVEMSDALEPRPRVSTGAT